MIDTAELETSLANRRVSEGLGAHARSRLTAVMLHALASGGSFVPRRRGSRSAPGCLLDEVGYDHLSRNNGTCTGRAVCHRDHEGLSGLRVDGRRAVERRVASVGLAARRGA